MTDALTFKAYQALLKRSGRLRCRVVSDSMLPLLRLGDVVEVEPLGDPCGLKRFDVVVYHTGDRPQCHFVWNHNRLSGAPSIAMRSLKDCVGDEIPVSHDLLLGRVKGLRIPFWLRAKVALLNWLRGTA